MGDGEFRAFGQDFELRVGHDGRYLEDGVVVGIEPRHFQVDPDQSLFLLRIGSHALALFDGTSHHSPARTSH